jgi:hypothetical protein
MTYMKIWVECSDRELRNRYSKDLPRFLIRVNHGAYEGQAA